MASLERYLRDLVIRKKIFFLILLLTLSLSAVLTTALYRLSVSTLHMALQSRLKHVAATAALVVDAAALDRVHAEADRGGPAWTSVESRLAEVRAANKLRSVYAMRPAAQPGHALFVVDTSSETKVGQDYDAARAPALLAGFERPSVDADVVVDEFGATLSGYAPVRRSDGSVAGLVGLDMDASDVLRLGRRFKRLAAGITGAFLLVSLLASAGFARMLTRPIVEMRDRILLVNAGRLETRMPVSGSDEVGQLSAAVNRMIDTLSHYLPVKLVGQVLGSEGDLRLGGSRARVTAYFSDVAGSTTISEKLAPEAVVSLLNEYLSVMSDVIEDLGGTIDKYEGDAIMAFWGAPLSQADHAALACEAALRQMEAIVPLREKWRREGKPEVSFRVGLNSGDVVAGNMGSNRRFNYTIMGDVVNLASRLEGANKNYGSRILIGESTHALVKDAFECRELDRVRVVGKTVPVSVYELLGRRGAVAADVLAARDRFQSALAAYRARRWDEAEGLFGKDDASSLYRLRIAEWRAAPPPEGWDGTHDLRGK